MSIESIRAAIAAQRGVTLIELVAFIVIMGISVTALLSMYRAVLPRGATPAQITLATQLAQERMELILGQRAAFGYSTTVLTDPCSAGTPPAVCTDQLTPAGLYSIVVTGINPPVQFSGLSMNNYRMFGVKVLGPEGTQLANLSAVIANYLKPMHRARASSIILRQFGFSLVELVVVIVVLGTVAAMGAIVVRDGMLGYLRGRELTSADWQGRIALERITRELRDVAAIGAGSCDSSAFAYSDISAVPVSYSYVQSTRTLLRNGQPLADNVAGLRFYCLQSNVQATVTPASVYYITVSMVVSTANTSATYRSTIKPRNF